ncbi:MAG: hypothetical protein ACNI26_05995 [Terasakiella sp.]|uniref:hypothetical protein n=1 Tax=unclassified Terasakiella TaxID=2614952 RepID=UPI003B006126
MGSEELLLESGKSSELSAVLHTISESEANGEPKFSPNVCRELGKIVVCRTYATPIMELCHLIVCAHDLSPQKNRYEFLFWDSGAAHSSNFRHYCHSTLQNDNSDRLTIDTNGLQIQYNDGGFAIQFSRMPVLSALMEFLLTALGYCDIDDIFQTMLNGALNRKSVSEAANALSRLVYAYLREHLPTAQSQRKFRKILAFCEDDVDAIDDSMILNFWQEASIDEDKGVDFKTFDSVLSTFIRAIQAVESARSLMALNYAGTIGSEREAGEIDPDILSETLDSVSETISPLMQLGSPPVDRVKFLNKQECAHLENLLGAGELALRLPLSILRANIFTKSQAKLTQALRRQQNARQLKEIIAQGPEETYQDRQITYQNLRNHIERSVYASLHALALARSHETISIMLRLNPNIDMSPLSQHLGLDTTTDQDNVVHLHSKRIADHFIELVQNSENVGQDIAQLMQNAQTAYSGLSRKGFKDDLSQSPDLVQAFSLGASLLLDVARDIEAFLERLDQIRLAEGNWQKQFSHDLAVFCGQFDKIYARG